MSRCLFARQFFAKFVPGVLEFSLETSNAYVLLPETFFTLAHLIIP